MLQELRDGHVTIATNSGDGDLSCGPPYDFVLDREFPNREDEVALVKLVGRLLKFGGE